MSLEKVIKGMDSKTDGWDKVHGRVCFNGLHQEEQEELLKELVDLRETRRRNTPYPCTSTQEFRIGNKAEYNQGLNKPGPTWFLICQEGEEFLVDTEGYDYARYTAHACCFSSQK